MWLTSMNATSFNRPLILASASPRRVELLAQLGIQAAVQAANIDETALSGESPECYVQRIARLKVAAVLQQHPGALVLGADTTVVGPQGILGKPEDKEDARRMLMQLSALQHEVWTGVCLATDETVRVLAVRSSVRFCSLSPEDIDNYIASGEPMDKAGAYGIQGLGAVFISHLEGSYSAVMGLPLYETAKLLRSFGCNPLTVLRSSE